MHKVRRLTGLVLHILLACALISPALAGDSIELELLSDISRPGTVALMTAAVAMPLFDDDGQNDALRTADAMACAALLSIGAKRGIHSPRPDGTDNNSFPSSHATVAFAAATMAADRKPGQAPYWYGAAALIAYSRVRLKRHRTRDVIAGALLGFGVAKFEQAMPRGLLLSPFIDPETECTGVEVTWEF